MTYDTPSTTEQTQATEDLVLIGDSLVALVDMDMAGEMWSEDYLLLTLIADLFDELVSPETDTGALVTAMRAVYPRKVRASHYMGSEDRNEKRRGRRAGEEE